MIYDTSKYKIWNWKNIHLFHWILNPGLAVNELIFGQRVPKTMLIEKDNSKSLQERTVVPCPHCGEMHAGYKWSQTNNAFKNWFGLYCDRCGEIIPCVRNSTSLFLLITPFPIWIWFVKKWKQTWLKKQPIRYTQLNRDDIADRLYGYGWIRVGLLFGTFMYFSNIFIKLTMEGSIEISVLLIGIPIHTTGGLLFGYIMKLTNRKKNNIQS